MAVVCKLKEILEEDRITQKDVADNTGLSKQAISNIVNNRYSTPLESAYKISRFLNRSIEEVFVYVEEE